jgi:hypothetical protein
MSDVAPPRSRTELERIIGLARAEWAPRIDRYNYLLERRERADLELGRLRPGVEQFEITSHELDWEYFRRLQLDGVLPSLPRVRASADSDHKNDDDEGEYDNGGNDSDFEVGSKG